MARSIPNVYVANGDKTTTTLKITRRNGEVFSFLLDNESVSLVRKFQWSADVDGRGLIYACTNIKGRRQRLHRILTNAPAGVTVDHANGTLDHRFSNLRIATSSNNQHNRGLSRNNSSGFKGVTYVPRDRNWRARIGFQGKRFTLGRFDTAREAANAYDIAAARLHGAFARTNEAMAAAA